MPYRSALTIIMLSAIVAVGCGLYAYFIPLTGVTGTWGPLAAAFGALCTLIGGVLMVMARHRSQRFLLMSLLALGIVLTAFATYLLHQWVMLTALGVGALGWLGAVSGPEGDRV
ncbi:hypothetical protein LX81_04380 [Palleronia aestuarii]|uniref:Uncharacterized protein n=1 Tax=Palleronia aestuarii TaxID=568105 RepID=A0A2W7MNC1_9RHOB|nr:hypothetical protein [Palleronia aestuarii]PZX09815.1 hypothetical protein LX81_04380 [Palleronia aestuarii]